ncbi:unnamed protein product, partial [Brassica oleracea]
MSSVVWVCDPLLRTMFTGILSYIRRHLDFILYVLSVSSIKNQKGKKRIWKTTTRKQGD